MFREQEHPSDVEIWLADGVGILMRVGPTVESSLEEARMLGVAFVELADKAGMHG